MKNKNKCVLIRYRELVGVNDYNLWVSNKHKSTDFQDVIFREVKTKKDKTNGRLSIQRVVENQIPSLTE